MKPRNAYIQSLLLLILLGLNTSCKKDKTEDPIPVVQECLPALSLSLSDLENVGDTLIVNYQVIGEGNFTVEEIMITTLNGQETISNPVIPFNQQVIFKDSPPANVSYADILTFGKITGSGKIETTISYQYKLKRNGNNFNSGGIITDKCLIN